MILLNKLMILISILLLLLCILMPCTILFWTDGAAILSANSFVTDMNMQRKSALTFLKHVRCRGDISPNVFLPALKTVPSEMKSASPCMGMKYVKALI